MFVALSPVAIGCFFPSSFSDTTAHSDLCAPTIEPHRLLSFFLLPSFLRVKTRSLTTSYPFLRPELALMPRYLPLLLILRTTRHLTTQTSVSLFLSSCTYILSLSLASSLFLLVLRAARPFSLLPTSRSRYRFHLHHRPSPSRVYIAKCTIVTPASVLHGRRLRRVLCSFRQFNATMSHQRSILAIPPSIISSDCYTEIFCNFVSLFLRRISTDRTSEWMNDFSLNAPFG